MNPNSKSIDDIIKQSDAIEFLSKAQLNNTKKDNHSLSDFLKDVDDEPSKMAIVKLFDMLVEGGVAPTVKPLRDRSTWHSTYPEFEMPDFIKKISERDEEGANFAKRWMERENKKFINTYSEDLLGRKNIHGKEIPRADYHNFEPERIPGAVKGEQLYTTESLKKYQSNTGSPKIHVAPGDIQALISELAHYAQYKDLTNEEKIAARRTKNEENKKYGSPTLSRNIYNVEDTGEWEAHRMIEPQIINMFENLLRKK